MQIIRKNISIGLAGLTFLLGIVSVQMTNEWHSSTRLGKQLVESFNSALVDNDRERLRELLSDTVSMEAGGSTWTFQREELLHVLGNASVKSVTLAAYSAESTTTKELCVSFDQIATAVPAGREIVHEARYEYCFVQSDGKWQLGKVTQKRKLN